MTVNTPVYDQDAQVKYVVYDSVCTHPSGVLLLLTLLARITGSATTMRRLWQPKYLSPKALVLVCDRYSSHSSCTQRTVQVVSWSGLRIRMISSECSPGMILIRPFIDVCFLLASSTVSAAMSMSLKPALINRTGAFRHPWTRCVPCVIFLQCRPYCNTCNRRDHPDG